MKSSLEKIIYHSTSIHTKPNKIMREKILPFFEEKNVKKVLDYGCGGYLKDSLFLTTKGLVVDAVDLEEQIKRVDPKKSRLVNSLTTEIISNNYDAALLNFVLNVIPTQEQRQAILEKVYNAIKAEGYLVLSLRNSRDIRHYVEQKGIPFNDGFLMKRHGNYTFAKGYKKDEIEDLLTPHNLNILKIYSASNSYIILSQK